MAAKGHATRVLEIRQTIKPGPTGKALVDEAKLELANTQAAAQLTQEAANRAIVSGDATPASSSYADLAKSAAQQAKDATDLATSLQGKIHDIGYAPYWKARTQFVAGFWPYDNEHGAPPTWYVGRIVWDQSDLTNTGPSTRPYALLSQFVEDPYGGVVDLTPVALQKSGIAPIRSRRMTCMTITKRILISMSGLHCLLGNGIIIPR